MLIFFKRTILTLSIFIFISLLSYSHSEDQDLKEILESIQKDITGQLFRRWIFGLVNKLRGVSLFAKRDSTLIHFRL